MEKVIVLALFAILIFFICRELFCWYWKVNKIVELLGSIDKRLDRLEKSKAIEIQDANLSARLTRKLTDS